MEIIENQVFNALIFIRYFHLFLELQNIWDGLGDTGGNSKLYWELFEPNEVSLELSGLSPFFIFL